MSDKVLRVDAPDTKRPDPPPLPLPTQPDGHLAVFCLCGGTLTGDVWPLDDHDPLVTLWRKRHSGEGHGATTQSIARTIRRHAQEDRP